MKRICSFLITLALIAGMVGCELGPDVMFSLYISSTAGGSVTTPGEGQFYYLVFEVVNLVAVADEGYHFVNWTGDVSTVAAVDVPSTNVTMYDSYNITANFAPRIEIWDWYDLDAIRDNLGGYYLLMNDLNSTTAGYEELASPTANGGKGWLPIPQTFTGIFDGQGYEIRDLFINRPDETLAGLFNYVGVGGVIKDVGVVNATMTGNSYIGLLVGENGGTVSNSYATGNMTGTMAVGGLVGVINWGGTVSNSYFTGSVTGDYSVGGLVGYSYNGTVSNSYSSGNVTGGDRVGGLVGGNGGGAGWGTVSNSYSTGNVTGGGLVGGLVGANIGTVSNSYSTGSATGGDRVGGLVGGNAGG
ncbi:MAG: hypothetical protein MUO80_00375, partial [Dehalococcoidia bacterium]|nr:hypothetical protein [Dehalococcoidia bacterium]